MTSYPLPLDEEQRLAELRRFAVLDTPPDKAFDAITELAAKTFAVPIAAVTLIDEQRQWFKSCVGLETREVGRNYAFCAHAILGRDVMVIPDARKDARFAQNPFVCGPPYIVFYAGAPLRTRNGLNLGTLTVSDTKLRTLTRAQLDRLAELARVVVDEIELRYESGERRRAIERLRLLQAAMQQCTETVMITTSALEFPGPEIVFVNPAFTELTGYTPDEVIGKTPRIFQGEKTDRATLKWVRAQLATGKEFRFEVINYRKNGSSFLLANHIAPIRGENGEVTHFIGTQSDATESHRAALLIHEAREEAERANRAKSEFLSRMSHELRAPLHAILGFAQLLEAEERGPEEADNVAQILRAGKHLLGLINEVLDVAQVESGKLSITQEAVNVREALLESVSLMKPVASEHGVMLGAPLGDLDLEVLASKGRLRQVMLNLLSNAVKYNRRQGTVAISCQRSEEYLRIEVADTGMGIAEKDFKKLFVPFQRLGPPEAAEGAGLGLSLSKYLVEHMGGRIGVESVVGRGSTFWVELLVAKPCGPRTSHEEGDDVRGADDLPQAGAGRTVLYIEDNLSNLRLVERIIARRADVTLISAGEGGSGIALARERLPDLILLDLQLPDMTGDEVLREIRANPATRDIPVVVISADVSAAHCARLRNAGANDCLTKPIVVRRLLSVIDAVKGRP